MKSRDFAFWLQGFFELGGGTDGLSVQQVAMVKQHLALVFKHDSEMEHPPIPLTNPAPAPQPLPPLTWKYDPPPTDHLRVYC